MRLFRHPRWQHLDYRLKVATTQENKPPTQGTRQWTFTTPRWRCGSILLPSLNAGVPEPTGGLRWMTRDHTDDKSTSVQVMAWCRQATSHYLNQCWPISPTPYGVTRPQWVNSFAPERHGCNIKLVNIQTPIKGSCFEHFQWLLPQMIATTTSHRWKVNIGSGSGLVLSGTKTLTEPMWTKIYDSIWCH